jgi:hypothetical protein
MVKQMHEEVVANEEQLDLWQLQSFMAVAKWPPAPTPDSKARVQQGCGRATAPDTPKHNCLEISGNHSTTAVCFHFRTNASLSAPGAEPFLRPEAIYRNAAGIFRYKSPD